jgi:hypothetical protein
MSTKRSVQNIQQQPTVHNVGDYLYYKGQKQREEQARQQELKKLENLKKQEQDLTFHPKISDMSERIIVKNQHNSFSN